jgi:hypothetical protein
MSRFKTWVAHNQALSAGIFAVMFLSTVVLISMLSGGTSNLTVGEETVGEETVDGTFTETVDDVFADGWADANSNKPQIATFDNTTIYYTPTLYADSEDEASNRVSEMWEQVADATVEANQTNGATLSFAAVSAYATGYYAKEIITEDTFLVLSDVVFNPDSTLTCNYSGQLVAAGTPYTDFYVPSVFREEAVFLNDWDRDEEYVNNLQQSGFFLVEVDGVAKQMGFIVYSEMWQEIVFVNMVLNEDNTVDSAYRHVLSSYVDEEDRGEETPRVLKNNESLTLLAYSSYLTVDSKTGNVEELLTSGEVEAEGFWYDNVNPKDFILKQYRDFSYTFDTPYLLGLTKVEASSIYDEVFAAASEGTELVYNFDDNTLYKNVSSEDYLTHTLHTLDNVETSFVCTTEE